MKKIKNIVFALGLAIVLYACGDNGNRIVNPYADVDHKALAISDNDSIVNFLKTHYYDAALDSIKELTTGKTSLFDDTGKLITMNITANDIDYKLYVYKVREGIPSPVKGFPSIMDSLLVNYRGIELTKNNIKSDPFDSNTATWISLGISGWANGFTNFKGGENVTNNGPITYTNTGRGYLFIPSGLAYPSINYRVGQQTNALFDKILVFDIELLDFIENTDHDNDNVPTLIEDLDGDGNPRNDDTDGDRIPNYLDTDDDGDGKLTKDEDANGDGNPANDFSDPNNPTIPDYLNKNIR